MTRRQKASAGHFLFGNADHTADKDLFFPIMDGAVFQLGDCRIGAGIDPLEAVERDALSLVGPFLNTVRLPRGGVAVVTVVAVLKR